MDSPRAASRARRAPRALRAVALAAAAVPALAAALTGCGSSNPASNNNPPIASIVFPAAGAILSPVGFKVRVEATDDKGVSRVEFSVDGTVIGVDDSAPYEAYALALGLSPGVAHTVEAVAVDTDNARTTRQVPVSVRARVYRQLTQIETGIEHKEPAWSSDGTRIAYARGGTAPGTTKNIYVIPSSAAAGLGQAVTTTLLQDGNPSFSPNGQWIAFESNRNGDKLQIFAVNPFSGLVVDLAGGTLGNSSERRPSWGLDEGLESWIVYDTDREGASRRDLYMVRVATESDTVLVVDPPDQFVNPDLPADTNPTDDLAPVWSSDGRIGACSNRTGLYAATVLDPFGGFTAAVIPGTNSSLVEAFNVSLSPFDAYVAFTEDPTIVPKVFVVATGGPGSSRWEVAPSGGADAFINSSDPAWSPDGSRIAFVSTRTGTAEIWIVE